MIEWTLDGASTPLGTGPEVDLEDLGVGAHVVTLTATNRDGLSAETSVSLSVVDDLSLPGPTLSVAPTQVAFHVAPGETQLQSADLEVSNIGDGMIGWMASASAPWLGVLPLSGPTPSTMTLTADPLTVADGQALETIVVVTPDAGTGLPVPVRVVLAKGDLFAGVGGTVTTTTLVSTTTTTLPECVPPDCDDGDACTADAWAAKCAACHNETTLAGGLHVSAFGALMLGGKDGEVIVPGDPAGSLLMTVQSGQHFANFSAAELEIVRVWIEAGAPEN